MNNILEQTIALIQKVNCTEQLGTQKKKFVMDFLQRTFTNPEEWMLYEGLLSELVDLLVAVGKHKKDFNLVKNRIFPCCR